MTTTAGVREEAPTERTPDDGCRQLVAGRLEALRAEYDKSQTMLAELERQEAFLRERLLMLRGAVQALEDLRGELEGSGVG
jgi:hypothetical protein